MQEKKQELEKRLLDVNDRMGNASKKVPKKGKIQLILKARQDYKYH